MTEAVAAKPTRQPGRRKDGTVNCPNRKGRKGFLPRPLHPFDPTRLSPEERAQKKAELEAYIAAQRTKLADLQAQDPFWWFRPAEGITEQAMAFLRRWLKEEDVPARLDCQRDVFGSQADLTLVAGGNQSGKTLTIAIDTLIQMTGQVPEAMRAWYPAAKLAVSRPFRVRVVGQDYENGLLKNVIPTYKRWSPKEYLKGGSWETAYSAEQRTVQYVDKDTQQPLGFIEFMSNQQDVASFQGPPRDRINFDEQPRYEVFRENLARFATAAKVSVWFGMTPTEGLTWTKDEVLDAADGVKIAAFKLTTAMNPAAHLETFEAVVAGLSSYDEIKMRLLGEFVSLSGLVYGALFDPKVHVIAPFETRCTCGRSQGHPPACPAAQYYVLRGLDPHLVTPSAVVWVAMDREGHKYVDTCLFRDVDTARLKAEIAAVSKGMRLGWAACDKSSNSDIKAFGDRNIFRELLTPPYAITGLKSSEKYVGSIRAGVDEIKQDLRINEKTGRPTLFIMDRPENKPLIQAFRTMERERWANEDVKGPKDKIAEGKYHHHAALRYLYQFPMTWYPEVESVPVIEDFDPEVAWA